MNVSLVPTVACSRVPVIFGHVPEDVQRVALLLLLLLFVYLLLLLLVLLLQSLLPLLLFVLVTVFPLKFKLSAAPDEDSARSCAPSGVDDWSMSEMQIASRFLGGRCCWLVVITAKLLQWLPFFHSVSMHSFVKRSIVLLFECDDMGYTRSWCGCVD